MSRRQLLAFGGALAFVVALLGVGYFWFLRTDYVVLAQGVRPADASPILAELDKRGTPYRLEDGGATILVPDTVADATRVAIEGSDAAARGQIGFELFNKSDMGLTNFAQKINYQRALQGELVRTITQMEGVERARVHLALPERALFRAERSEPTAAVTIEMKPGRIADAARVAGIQRLVSAAVPDLPEGKVVVLDGEGRTISAVAAADMGAASQMSETQALQAYYAARVRAVVEPRLPGQKFALRVLLLPIGDGGDVSGGDGWNATASGDGAGRNFRLRVLLVTAVAVPNDERVALGDAVASALTFDAGRGDAMAFEVGPVDAVDAPPAVAVPASTVPVATVAGMDTAPVLSGGGSNGWIWIVIAALALVGGVLLVLRRRTAATLSDQEHEDFAARLRRQLNLSGAGDASA